MHQQSAVIVIVVVCEVFREVGFEVDREAVAVVVRETVCGAELSVCMPGLMLSCSRAVCLHAWAHVELARLLSPLASGKSSSVG